MSNNVGNASFANLIYFASSIFGIIPKFDWKPELGTIVSKIEIKKVLVSRIA